LADCWPKDLTSLSENGSLESTGNVSCGYHRNGQCGNHVSRIWLGPERPQGAKTFPAAMRGTPAHAAQDREPSQVCRLGGRQSLQELKTSQRAPEIAHEPTGHGLPLSKCEAYNRVYDQSCGSS
jgi:hypothetical protein